MKTGYLYNPLFVQHDQPGHPESPKRLLAIIQYLEENNLLNDLIQFEGRAATDEELETCHLPAMLAQIKQIAPGKLDFIDPDTYMNEYSYAAARFAAGGLMDMVDAIVDAKIDNGFGLVRPPGHHATRDRAMGFCLHNSVALAARYALQRRGLERVAIVDFDVHHGNGTQDIFESDPAVLFISSHGFPMYPGSGAVYETGSGKATGTKVNLPMPEASGDKNFQAVYSQIAFPVLKRFKPQLILVSAGFDAHFLDPIADRFLGLSLDGYYWLAKSLVSLAAEICGGKILFSLEGGYDTQVLAVAAGNVFRLLTGKPDFENPFGFATAQEPDITGLLQQLLTIHKI